MVRDIVNLMGDERRLGNQLRGFNYLLLGEIEDKISVLSDLE